MDLTDEQIERYSRNIILTEVGGQGQERLGKASVFLIGAGGLGSPIGYYLAAAGVGKMALVDDDVVELNNLQRQIAHKTVDVGKPKVLSAKETFEALNPDIEVVAVNERLTSENIMGLIEDYDIIVDGSDNFPTRYLANDAAVLTNKTLVTGAVLRFDGQAMTVIPKKTPCYRCLFEQPPPPGFVPSCEQAGIMGVLPGLVGMVQATE
ncbi:MAG: ThiF family adenylyltransferase, partial [Terriglobia bacterium]